MRCTICKVKIKSENVGSFYTCPACLEALIIQQGKSIKLLSTMLEQSHEIQDIGIAQTNRLIEELKGRTSNDEFDNLMEKIVSNPYNLKATDVC